MSVNMKQSGALVPIASLTKAITPLGAGDCYSTEERQVGCWTDGKPLYQRSFITTTSNSNSVAKILVDLGATCEIKKFWGIVNNVRDINSYIDNYSWSVTWIAGNHYQIGNLANGSIYMNLPCNITVQYTKTTDTAGSGIWTPSGTYAKHMSTTEQVVGTYLGETVYAKVIDNLNITLNSSIWNNIANIAGAKDLVDLKMWGYFAEYYLINYSLAHIDSGGQGLLEIRVDSEANTRIVKRIYAEYTKTS